MRWCHHCKKLNSGWPFRCHHCTAGLEGRLCPRNHVNPTDPRLTFCGECGQPLERTWGAGFSIRPYIVSACVLAGTVGLACLIALAGQEGSMTSVVIALVVLVVGIRFALGMLPPSVRGLLGALVQGIGNLLFAVLFRTGNKGRG